MAEIIVRIGEELIQPSDLFSHLADAACGAEVVFFGTVRNQNHGRAVVALEYDAQVSLAETLLKRICEEAVAELEEPTNIVALHRTGKLAVGAVSVGVGVSAPHRREAYHASRYIIDQLKKRVPIWKKEYYANGESEWSEGCSLCETRS